MYEKIDQYGVKDRWLLNDLLEMTIVGIYHEYEDKNIYMPILVF